MAIFQLKDKDAFRIEDKAAAEIYYGSNQEWYPKKWQRMAGCGPSAAANIMYYLMHMHDTGLNSFLTKDDCLALMNELWYYVTPTLGGVSSTGMFSKGIDKYIKKKKLNIKIRSIDIPKNKSERPGIDQVHSFIIHAFEKESPVAFLNLEHGTIEELESWHWVTIISLDYQEENGSSWVQILDGGLVKRIDLLEWLRTTKLGGGFVSCEKI